MHKPETVWEKEKHKISCDFEIQPRPENQAEPSFTRWKKLDI